MKCEIAVIGSGPGGAIVAHQLALAGKDVLLIEEGSDEATAPFSLQELRSKYRNNGQTIAFGSPGVQYVEGRCVGGGSEINSGLYHRLPEVVREEWEQRLGIEKFRAADLEPHYQFCEQKLSVQTSNSFLPLASLKLAQGAERLGWKTVEVPRWFSPEGTRHSMNKTFIPEFLRAGGRLAQRTKVQRLCKGKSHWTLVTSALPIEAQHVFVCGGAIQTPALLRRSGIKQNIGNRLALHPTVKLTARFAEEINGDNAGVPVHQVKEFSPAMSLGGSVSKLPHLMAAHANHPGFPDWFLEHWKHLFIYYAMIACETRGKVRTLAGCDAPLVSYKMGTRERTLLADAQKKLADVLFAAGAQEVITGTGERVTTTSQLPETISKQTKGIMTIHLCGSCPMGENRALAATDSFGKVHGFDTLYICDASLLGGSPSVNPQGIIMAMARRNVLHFLGKL